MKKTKKIISFMLCIVMILAMSVPAFADSPDGSDITPYVVPVYYINGYNVNFRSGASLKYSSGGHVNYPHHCEPRYKNGVSIFKDEYGCTDENGKVYEWRYICMNEGDHAGEKGYVVSKFVTQHWINADS